MHIFNFYIMGKPYEVGAGIFPVLKVKLLYYLLEYAYARKPHMENSIAISGISNQSLPAKYLSQFVKYG